MHTTLLQSYMIKIGIIKEEKIPADNRVALSPDQCRWLLSQNNNLSIIVQPSAIRCFQDIEYERAGAILSDDLQDCSILLGIKEAAAANLLEGKTYLFFSHTKKKQPHNRDLLKAILNKKITLIDYECLEHEDGQRIIGFGFFAGIVGAHNGIMAYGKRTGLYQLERVFRQKNFKELIHSYFGLRLPNLKVAVTGSGRVAHGLIEIMNLLGLHEVEPDDYLKRRFAYPVYTQLKGKDLYEHEITGAYSREDFHQNPQNYQSRFLPYAGQTDILLNGVYWEEGIPRLFRKEDISHPDFIIQTIADISDDKAGSIPVNMGSGTIEDPVYGVHKISLTKTAPYENNSIDIMAVSNLPNELPRDASRYFGEQLIKYVWDDLLKGGNEIIHKATITSGGRLTENFSYLQDYVAD